MSRRRLNQLILRARAASRAHGVKSQLAIFLEVSPQAVSQYLRGTSVPGAEVALRMLEWVTAREAEKKRLRPPGKAIGAVTQSAKPTINEKSKSGRKRP